MFQTQCGSWHCILKHTMKVLEASKTIGKLSDVSKLLEPYEAFGSIWQFWKLPFFFGTFQNFQMLPKASESVWKFWYAFWSIICYFKQKKLTGEPENLLESTRYYLMPPMFSLDRGPSWLVMQNVRKVHKSCQNYWYLLRRLWRRSCCYSWCLYCRLMLHMLFLDLCSSCGV